MRIWDIPVEKLCRKHLLGEHNELHAIFSIIVNNHRGFANHPEVKRWRNNLRGLSDRHRQQVVEMERRGYRHISDLGDHLLSSSKKTYWQTPEQQTRILKEKSKRMKCGCKV